MSTCNFETQENFDLWILNTDGLGMAYPCDENGKPDETKEPKFDEWLYQMDIDTELAEVKAVIQKVLDKKDLNYFKVIFKDGYYTGIQAFIKDTWGTPEKLDNEDCQYYYGEYRSVAIRKYNSEKRYINKKVLPALKEAGFVKLICVGVFSNGEAVYEIAS